MSETRIDIDGFVGWLGSGYNTSLGGGFPLNLTELDTVLREYARSAEWIAAVDRNAERIATYEGEYGTPARDDEG
jgi:hypothetical protein